MAVCSGMYKHYYFFSTSILHTIATWVLDSQMNRTRPNKATFREYPRTYLMFVVSKVAPGGKQDQGLIDCDFWCFDPCSNCYALNAHDGFSLYDSSEDNPAPRYGSDTACRIWLRLPHDIPQIHCERQESVLNRDCQVCSYIRSSQRSYASITRNLLYFPKFME